MLSRWAFATRQPGWWEDFDEPLPSRDRLYPGLEETAQHLYAYDVRQVPDLLHIPDYSRSQYLAVYPHATEAAVFDYLKHLQQRQATLLKRTPPLGLNAVLDENALARQVGGPDCMLEQIRRLRELADRVHIDLRYLPGRVGAHPAMRVGGFTVLEFTDLDDPDVVYLDSHTGARYLELPAEYRRIFASVYALSAPISEYAEPSPSAGVA